MTTASDIEQTLIGMADSRNATILQRFFKTDKGQYGEGDKFLGIKNPALRMVVREAWRDVSMDETALLVRNPWHEVRLCGLLIMVEKMERAVKEYNKTKLTTAVECISDTYFALHPYINNWDLVDLSCTHIAGWREVLCSDFSLMDEWAKPFLSMPNGQTIANTLWQRRIAMVSTWLLMRQGDMTAVTRRAALMLSSHQDLLYKAAGWMLRELGKQPLGLPLLLDFLEEHVGAMPSIMLSYATEKFAPTERHYWQAERRRLQNKQQTMI